MKANTEVRLLDTICLKGEINSVLFRYFGELRKLWSNPVAFFNNDNTGFQVQPMKLKNRLSKKVED